jgi:hypothetical protein
MRNVHIYPASKCEVCGKTYKRKDKLKKHMLVHTREREQQEQEEAAAEATKSAEKKNVFCQYCGKVYAKYVIEFYNCVVPIEIIDINRDRTV